MKKIGIGFVIVTLMLFNGVFNITPVVEIMASNSNYIILNPYASVNWTTYGQYKANFHSHSVESDGGHQPAQMIEDHYAKGYDIMALTDHSFTNTTWDRKDTKATYLTTERLAEINSGSDRDGRGMIGIPYSNEQSISDHLNTFWANFNNTAGSTLESKIAQCELLGGISHINHPGRSTGGSNTDNNGAVGEAASNNTYNIAKYVKLFKKYPSCVGMEIINKKDAGSYSDRILWDNILSQTMPFRPVWAFSNDDTHSKGATGYSYNMMLMPRNTLDNVRYSMENGIFYAVAKISRRELGQDFVAIGPAPVVTNIVVNENEDSITIEGQNYNTIEWIANGKIIASGNTIDLNDFEDKISAYIRVQLKGDGGIAFAQPFGLKKGNSYTIISLKENESVAGNVYSAKQTYIKEIPIQLFKTGGTINTPIASVTFDSDMLSEEVLLDAQKVELCISLIDTAQLSERLKDVFDKRPLLDVSIAIDGVKTKWKNENSPLYVSINYKPNEEELKNSHSIVGCHMDGNKEFQIIHNGKYNLETEEVTFSLKSPGLCGIAFNNITFSDIQMSWARKEIEALAARGIVNGKSQKTYAPNSEITRADFILLLMGILNKATTEYNDEFSDVSQWDYYYDAVNAARELGITHGISKNKFNPSGHITRQDMMVLIGRALEISGVKLEQISDLTVFSDSINISDYAVDSVAKLVAVDIIKGDKGKIRPGNNLSRAEAAMVIYSMHELIESKR